jgi:hypothetical protein
MKIQVKGNGEERDSKSTQEVERPSKLEYDISDLYFYIVVFYSFFLNYKIDIGLQ